VSFHLMHKIVTDPKNFIDCDLNLNYTMHVPSILFSLIIFVGSWQSECTCPKNLINSIGGSGVFFFFF